MSHMTCAQAAPTNGTAAERVRRDQNYLPVECVSTPRSHFSRQEDETATALGSLLLYVLTRDLPRPERKTAWALVQRWATEMVDDRLNRHVGAVA